MSNLINEELDTMKYLFEYQKGKVISEQTTPVAPATAAPTAQDVIMKIQTTLNTKYGAKLVVDGKWGPMTQSAFENATKGTSAAPSTETPKHGGRKVDDVGNTFVYDGYNKKWVSDSEYLKLYNNDGTQKTK